MTANRRRRRRRRHSQIPVSDRIAAKRARAAEQRRHLKERRAAMRQALPADHLHHPFTIFRPSRLAALLDVERTCIWRWRTKGILPEPISIGGITGWTFAQIEHLFARRLQEASDA
jgi:predicted DNA-binding transcriptional regulator AlpA